MILFVLEPCITWGCADIEATCLAGFSITMRHANFHAEDGEIGVMTTIVWSDFPLLITDDMARLPRYFNVSLE